MVYGSSAHLIINCAFDQTRCGADHFAQHLTNCVIFGQSRRAVAIGSGLRLGLGLVALSGLWLGTGLVIELSLGYGWG